MLKTDVSINQKNISAELVHFLYDQAKPTIVGSLIIASCLAYGLYSVVPLKVLFSWYIFMLVTIMLRYGLVQVYINNNTLDQYHIAWRNLFIVAVSLTGIGWALAGTLLVPAESVHQTFIVCALAGAAAGTLPFFSGSRAATFAFVIPTLLPFTLWSFHQGDTPHNLLGFLTFLYLGFLLLFCLRIHHSLRNAIELKFENKELVTSLTLTKNEMHIMNQELENEIAERKFIEKLLRESEEQYRLVTDALPVLISYVDMRFNYQFINKAHEEWFKKPLVELTGKSMKEVHDNATFMVFKEHIDKINSNSVTYETIMQFHKEEERYVSVTLIPHIKQGEMHGFFSLISDITPRINYLATHDALTDLPNRSFFTARFTQSLKRAQTQKTKIALLFLDLDHFKNINYTLGHDVGDELLKKVAERIKSCLQDVDFLARLGGDEFVILIEDISTEFIIHIANKICQLFSSPFDVYKHEIFITASIGISIYPEDGQEIKILLKNADIAIYRAKESGRNTFKFYTQEMNEQILKKISLETNLRSAMQQNEFSVHYQPIIDIASNSVASLEALLRWQHNNVFIKPSEFIPVAEDAGLIVPIGEWVLRTVCKQGVLWRKNNLRIAVNLSARQFKERNLTTMIIDVLKETGLNAENLILELTESLIMDDVDYNAKVIHALKDLGITISIDDFGTGYSSLNYLRRFPIDILKIDRSFITDIAGTTKSSEDASAIVRAILAMAHSLKMKVVAEGVETMEQYTFLKNQGCDKIQGYLFSRPLSATDTTGWLQRGFSIEDYLKQKQVDDVLV